MAASCHPRRGRAGTWQRGAVTLRRTVLVALAAAAAACGGGSEDASIDAVDPSPEVTATVDGGTEAADPEPVTEMVWTTTYDVDGFGYVLTVEGTVGEDHAAYTMQVDLLLERDDAGMEEPSPAWPEQRSTGSCRAPTPTDSCSGSTRRGAPRSVWSVTDAGTATRGSSMTPASPWGMPSGWRSAGTRRCCSTSSPPSSTSATTTRCGGCSTPPGPAPTWWPPRPTSRPASSTQPLTPWIGLAGPGYPVGGPVTGDADAGEATWTQVLTYEPDGADGELGGLVRWSPGQAAPPDPPQADDVTTAPDISARLAG